jgi:hypothetical protein
MDPNVQQSVPQNMQQVSPAQPVLTNQQTVPQSQTQVLPVQQTSLQQQPPVTAHIGKETPPILTKVGSELASDPDVLLHQEVAAAGVEISPRPEEVITPDAQAVGVTPVNTATVVPSNPSLILPLPADKVESIIKTPHKVLTSSLLWFATLLKKVMIKQAAEKGEQHEPISA